MTVAIPSEKQKLINQINQVQAKGGPAETRIVRGIVRNYWREFGKNQANALIDELGLAVEKFDEESPIVAERNGSSENE
jgi:hypothetical protein